MTIDKKKTGDSLVISIEGKLNNSTAPQLEAELQEGLDGITNLTIDLADLVYVSSAGLRVLLLAQKKMNAKGKMTVKNVCDEIMEVFEDTGFSSILTIE